MVRELGELPTYSYKDYTEEGFYEGGDHGTACAEIVHDVAPEATLDLLRINSIVDFENAIDRVIDYNGGAITLSLSWNGSGMGDGKGPPAYLPHSVLTCNERASIRHVPMRRGSVLFFLGGTVCHGAYRWEAESPRRTALFTYRHDARRPFAWPSKKL